MSLILVRQQGGRSIWGVHGSVIELTSEPVACKILGDTACVVFRL